ncbi:GDSL esterase/lipase At5g14450-like [Diospyros lotus]|uniref:GDSL esterase/lipase At5g14450-like n=1 Tax=Diospyros lotus TaxID=55363 RepID=UPI00225A907A|nr:GDSL esterase/lipase At5g14450-like [Diospyros lotus]
MSLSQVWERSSTAPVLSSAHARCFSSLFFLDYPLLLRPLSSRCISVYWAALVFSTDGKMALPKIVSVAALVLLVAAVGGVEVTRLRPCDFPAIYNFGDSNSDTGGISAAFEPIRAPYGENFFRKPAGRDCDGRLIVDFIAEHLRLPYLSAYLNSLGTSYRHGANFATGGSTIRRQNETIFEYGISPFSLDMQAVQFDQFKARTADLYNEATADRSKLPEPQEFSKALYTLDIGQNDLSVGFRKLSNDQLRAAMPDIVEKFASAVQNLYQQGARSFWVHNTGPIGCLPVATMYIRNPPPGFLDQFGCIKGQNEMAMEFNRQLKDRVRKLRAELPHAALIYVDVYTAKYGLISDTKNQGFTDPIKICCGHHENDVNVWCGQRGVFNGTEVYGASCATPSTYISWDGVHYSEAANHWVANRILNGSLSDPPVPVTHACYQHAAL